MSASKCKVDDSSIKDCSTSVQAFTNALRSEQSRRNAWQREYAQWKFYMDQRASIIQQAQQQLQAGHTSMDGYIWDGNTHVQCAGITPAGAGHFNLCGYHPYQVQGCLSCARVDSRGRGSPFYQRDSNGNPWECNCASCAEQCCKDCSTSSALRYNPNVSWYQGQYNHILNQWPVKAEPKFVAIPITVGDFLCMQCTQCTEFSNLSAGQELSIGNTSQVQQCVANMQAQRRSDIEATARDAEEARLAAEFKKKLLIIFLLIFIFVVVSFLIYMFVGGETVVETSKT